VDGETLIVGVVDIGTNSMRLLVTDGEVEAGRWVQVTGLGRGVDASGRLADEAMLRTIEVLDAYGDIMDSHRVRRRYAVATSATRDAENREEFLDRVTTAIGVRPDVIGGDVEGELAYAGATSDLPTGPDYVVSDVGGGSTEFVRKGRCTSIDIGSVRLTDRILADRPPAPGDMERARRHARDLFEGIEQGGQLVGVAGTWTSLAAIHLGLPEYDSSLVHHHRADREGIEELTTHLAGLSLEETERIPSLDPARAPVILAGAVIAGCVMDAVGSDTALISERDTLDGLAMQVLGLR
jgi:exopolyphosphatase/guanosine-5'-triphosphate,3'-diphosphate pyrophosphatase